jgi:membrane protease subunit (stomatin/prohibitin family)
MLIRRRPLARAAMLGGTAYVAGRAGARAGARSAAPQQQYAEPEYAPAPAAYAAPPGESNQESMAELSQLKQLLDTGVLTQAEFDAQKQKILQQMT